MSIREHVSDVRGVLVVTREEGANLGLVSSIYVDPSNAKVSGFGVRQARIGRDDGFVPTNHIVSLGKNVLFVDSQSGYRTGTAATLPPGRSLKELQGMWVTTQSGKHLGTLIDVDIRSEDWSICELRLADDKVVAVESTRIIIGQDEILVPTEYDQAVVTRRDDEGGFLGRLFGTEAVEDVKRTVRQVLKRKGGGRGGEEG